MAKLVCKQYIKCNNMLISMDLSYMTTVAPKKRYRTLIRQARKSKWIKTKAGKLKLNSLYGKMCTNIGE